MLNICWLFTCCYRRKKSALLLLSDYESDSNDDNMPFYPRRQREPIPETVGDTYLPIAPQNTPELG